MERKIRTFPMYGRLPYIPFEEADIMHGYIRVQIMDCYQGTTWQIVKHETGFYGYTDC